MGPSRSGSIDFRSPWLYRIRATALRGFPPAPARPSAALPKVGQISFYRCGFGREARPGGTLARARIARLAFAFWKSRMPRARPTAGPRHAESYREHPMRLAAPIAGLLLSCAIAGAQPSAGAQPPAAAQPAAETLEYAIIR